LGVTPLAVGREREGKEKGREGGRKGEGREGEEMGWRGDGMEGERGEIRAISRCVEMFEGIAHSRSAHHLSP
jgi:hypothetical protein